MSEQLVNQRLRLFLLGVAGSIFIGVIVELLLTGHTESPPQWIPILLSGLGAVVAAAALAWPGPATLWAVRGVAGLAALGSAFGLFEHLEHNFEFAMEIRPGVAATDVVWEALSGPNPLLAPGILALAAVLALAATYAHPALARRA